MSESSSNSRLCNNRQASIRALLVVSFLTALLWACAALPAQATKGGIPAAPDAASGQRSQGNGPPAAHQLPNAAAVGDTGAGGEATVPTPPDPPEGGSPGGGANDLSGPYDPDPANPGASGVGEPSGNGASIDNNGNRPCAGCVGNADYKNPPGQLPDGGDHNKGYECDGNQGVGKMNPAHSGCAPGGGAPPVTPPTPPVTPPTPPVTPPTTAATPPAGPPPGAPPAGGESEKPPEVGGVKNVPPASNVPATPPTVPVIPVSRTVAAPAAETLRELPFTGSEPLLLGLLGLLALGAGLALARLARILETRSARGGHRN
jgi:hypothetical protein